MLLHAAAYLLFQHLRARLARTDLARAQVNTLRVPLLKVGARVRASVRRVRVQRPQAYAGLLLWERVLQVDSG